jgi:hypothetical protein
MTRGRKPLWRIERKRGIFDFGLVNADSGFRIRNPRPTEYLFAFINFVAVVRAGKIRIPKLKMFIF